MAKINLRNLSKSWVSVVGVNQFNLEIGVKEFLVLLGPLGDANPSTKVHDPRTTARHPLQQSPKLKEKGP